ncbi:fumarate hydratase [Blautia argi]|uniref:fumarate hydratase n=1 Tax=Blautia argi TaxID=1912897 RepID=UPI0029435EAA|nr:fumarate hydratase [Blautia argi]
MNYDVRIVEKVSETLVRAGSTFLEDKKKAYERAISAESNEQAKWTMEKILENAIVAEKNQSPLCDDTGIPHLVLEIGENCIVSGNFLESIKEGVRRGLQRLPGRPMAIKGNDSQRLDQSLGMDEDPGALEAAPLLVRTVKEDVLRLHILMFGGGPAIRGKTYRVFHKHNVQNVLDEIVSWATDSTTMLGCTPCTLAVGVGRSHYEASAMMLQALVDGTYEQQNEMEKEITERVNKVGIGPLGLGGTTTILATFMKVGPQRASGVRVVCMRPCCCFEPRIASVEL